MYGRGMTPVGKTKLKNKDFCVFNRTGPLMILTMYLITITPKKEKEKSWYIYVGLETTATIIIGGSNLLIKGLSSFEYQCLIPLGLLLSQSNFIYIYIYIYIYVLALFK